MHEGKQRVSRRLVANRMRHEQAAQPQGLRAEVGSQKGIALRRLVTLVEEQVERLPHCIEPGGELRGVRQVERDALFAQYLPRPHEAFHHRRFAR